MKGMGDYKHDYDCGFEGQKIPTCWVVVRGSYYSSNEGAE